LTILGGAIAGVIGLVASWYDRHLAARSRHFQEHKENLSIVSKLLVALQGQIWPPYKNMEGFEIPEGFPPNVTAQFDNFSLLSRPLLRASRKEAGIEAVYIDPRLFADLATHFPELHRSLEAIDDLARTDGPRVLQPMYDLSAEIYKALEGRQMTPLYPGADSQSRSLNRGYLASATFNVLAEPERMVWRTRYPQTLAEKAAPDLEALATDLRKSVGKKVDEMIILRESTISKIDNCLDAIDDVRHSHRHLKHRCPYV
jgi:hypothetical protein